MSKGLENARIMTRLINSVTRLTQAIIDLVDVIDFF